MTTIPSRPSAHRVRSSAAIACFLVACAAVIVVACGPPLVIPSTSAELHRRLDSLSEARISTQSPEERLLRYSPADLHGPVPRPKLPVGADSNDPVAYYRLGDSVKFHMQGLADRALYWATRLDPTMADAYYDRWDLRLHGDLYHWYPDGSVRSTRSRSPNELAAIDSLRRNALGYNPFIDGVLEIPPQITNLTERQANRDPRAAGLWAFARGDYRKAVTKLGEAIGKRRENAAFHFPRAYAWVHLNEPDSAIADLTALIDRLEQMQDSTVAPYVSKDLLYYEIGLLRVDEKRYADARAAYEHALLENLSSYMAHLRLSAVALILHDTATALNELETATLIRTDDPVLLTFHASILAGVHRFDEAEAELRTAIHVDTDYAIPYATLGQTAEQRHDTLLAIRSYREYLARASRKPVDRGWVEGRLSRLTIQR